MEYFTVQISHASKYGVNESIVLHTIIYFVLKNKVSNRNKKDGRFWTFNSYKGWVQSLPFFTEHQIRKALRSLREQGAVQVGVYNKKKYDKTFWYTISDALLQEAENSDYWRSRIRSSNGTKATDKFVAPIPYKEYSKKSKEKINPIEPY